jgi:hypothetical protein
MKKFSVILTLLLSATILTAQPTGDTDYSAEKARSENPTPEQKSKTDTAFALMKQVQQSGNYVESLTELFSDSIIPLPVGIKSDQ